MTVSAQPAAIQLSEELVSFVQGRVSILVASCDPGLLTSVVFGLGCRVAPDRRRMTILLPGAQAAACIADVRATGRVAVNFGLPSTNRCVQFKGVDAVVEPVKPFDLACVEQHSHAFTDELLPLREMTREVLETILQYTPEDLVAISFALSEGFVQTPGPGAGARL
ncbi:pyridoxamine 5'-phosphate oxidase family protein [Uliginosibacterium sp. H3]|uniref:Pyridoxamine 5'-phosphate oxidase family protein n=1 Tax=Uliginosibacterium silvisoli TaxID=3114758 RepID=A0ABU6K175_9RHOO|nr:pyridoxamine 5'-phosphate oxidase family protein [Uliginosibacterium sp. H3]